MLTRLEIRNFALIEALELELAPGMTVVTGETGAGKSIVVDAIAQILGDKASADLVRFGAEQAEIAASFSLTDAAPARQWLRDQGLDDDDGEGCIVRRLIPRQGRSRAFINGRQVAGNQLRELGEYLIELLGQNAQQGLLRPERQRALLDRFAHLEAELDELARRQQRWRAAQAALERYRSERERSGAEREWRRFVLEELERVGLRAGEWEELSSEARRLGAVEQLREAVAMTLSCLEDEGGALGLLGEAQRVLAGACQKDAALADSAALVDSAEIQVQEACHALRAYHEHLEADPARLEQIGHRLQVLQDLQRKHQRDMAGLLSLLEELRAELGDAEQDAERLHRLQAEADQSEDSYREQAKGVSAARGAAAPRLAQAIAAEIRDLGMPHATVKVDVQSYPDDPRHWQGTGWDQVELHFSANPGHPLQALARVASGGELARIGLALQVILAQPEQVDTLIFDEVDVGVGGAVAERIGRLLRRLGKAQQVLCVTHLPQVAAQAHHQLLVEKVVTGEATHSRIRVLDTQGRRDEVARMLGGIELDDSIHRAAQRLLDEANKT